MWSKLLNNMNAVITEIATVPFQMKVAASISSQRDMTFPTVLLQIKHIKDPKAFTQCLQFLAFRQ